MKWLAFAVISVALVACSGDSAEPTPTVAPSATPESAYEAVLLTERGAAYAKLIDLMVQNRDTDASAESVARGTCVSIADGGLGADEDGEADMVTLTPICLAVIRGQWGTASDQLQALFHGGDR